MKCPGSVGLVLSTAVSPVLQVPGKESAEGAHGFYAWKQRIQFLLSSWVAVKYYEGEACRMGSRAALQPR